MSIGDNGGLNITSTSQRFMSRRFNSESGNADRAFPNTEYLNVLHERCLNAVLLSTCLALEQNASEAQAV